MHVELLLEFLISVVYTKLLKTVNVKCLGPVDVGDPNKVALFATCSQGLVHMPHNPVKKFSIEMFRKGISCIGGLTANGICPDN